VTDARLEGLLSRAQQEFEQTLASIKAGQAAVSEAEERVAHAEGTRPKSLAPEAEDERRTSTARA